MHEKIYLMMQHVTATIHYLYSIELHSSESVVYFRMLCLEYGEALVEFFGCFLDYFQVATINSLYQYNPQFVGLIHEPLQNY